MNPINRNLSFIAFLLGLAAVVWVAIGYVGGSPLALGVSCTIAAVYVVGALEMRRFHGNTAALARALDNVTDNIADINEWLQNVPATLRNAVRLRIEGERIALPGPSVTPYLVGLLVLLGMLGTFLGMVVTLNGAVLALESTTDLHSIRSALAAPVKGLGVAFGTSVAGVATSAMLGLISTLCRRDRQQVGRLLDGKVAGALRHVSFAHQRQETFKALQTQAQTLPELVGKLDTMMRLMTDQNRQLGEQLIADQQRFHAESKELYANLAQSVDQSLKSSLTASATAAATAIEPIVTATMSGIAAQTSDLHGKLSGTVETQLAGLGKAFAQTTNTIGERWAQTLTRHEAASATQQQQLQSVLGGYADTFETRSAALLASVEAGHARVQADAAQQLAALTETTAASQQQLANALTDQFDSLTARLDQAVSQVANTFGERSQALLASIDASHASFAETTQAQQSALTQHVATQLDGIAQRFDGAVQTVSATWTQALDRHEAASDRLTQALDQTQTSLAETFAERSAALLAAIDTSHARFAETTQTQQSALTQHVATQLDGIAQRFDGAVTTVSTIWTTSLAKHEAASDRLTQALDQTQTNLAETFAERSAALLADQRTAQAAWQSEWATGEQQRQARFTDALSAMAAKLETQWQQAGDKTLAQQEEITQALGTTARDLVAAHQRQAETTIAEVTRLMQTAAEAPKAAAEVIGELRRELSASMARDNSLLEERSRIMETLGALLDAINHASTEQRSAIDALVATSAELLERVGSQFAAKVESEAGKLVDIGASVAGGALEVASLGEAFGHAVQLFSESNEKMMAALQRIEGGLAKSLTRSDEQLAYYVAQAREVIELSILSQKKMVDDLQRAGRSEA